GQDVALVPRQRVLVVVHGEDGAGKAGGKRESGKASYRPRPPNGSLVSLTVLGALVLPSPEALAVRVGLLGVTLAAAAAAILARICARSASLEALESCDWSSSSCFCSCAWRA